MIKIKPFHFKIAFVFSVLILIFYFFLIFTGENGLQDLNAMKQEVKNTKAKNERIKQENVEIYQKIDRIKTDPVFMENAARQELKMIGENEIVFKFGTPDSLKNKPAPPKTEAILPNPSPITPQNDAIAQKPCRSTPKSRRLNRQPIMLDRRKMMQIRLRAMPIHR